MLLGARNRILRPPLPIRPLRWLGLRSGFDLIPEQPLVAHHQLALCLPADGIPPGWPGSRAGMRPPLCQRWSPLPGSARPRFIPESGNPLGKAALPLAAAISRLRSPPVSGIHTAWSAQLEPPLPGPPRRSRLEIHRVAGNFHGMPARTEKFHRPGPLPVRFFSQPRDSETL